MLRIFAFLFILVSAPAALAQNKVPATYADQAGGILEAETLEAFLVLDPSDVIKGDPEAPLTIYEFSSFTCPHCGNLHQNVLPQIYADFIETGKANLVFRDFPLDRFAMGIGLLGQCLTEPDAFYAYVELVFANQQVWREASTPFANILSYAQESGLTQDTALACLQNQAAVDFLTARQQRAVQLVEVQGTPTLILSDGTRLVTNDAAAMAAQLEAAYAAVQAQ